jgi:hypothetical protein
VTTVIAGEHGNASTLAERVKTGANTVIWALDSTADRDSVGELAAAMIHFEAEASGQEIDSIVLADDSDAALAAALVGTKLPVDVLAVPDARGASSANGRVIAQLAAAYTHPA